MSITKKLIAIVSTLALMSSLVLVGCGGGGATNTSGTPSTSGTSGATGTDLKLIKQGVLTVGSDCDYPPFTLLEDGKPAGFEFELMQLIAKDMGLTLEYADPIAFDILPSQVAAGTTVDLGVSVFTITEERKQTVDFCDPYFDSNQACLVNSSSTYKSTKDLEGKTVGAQAATTGMDWANEHVAGITMKTFTQTSEGLQALQAGQIEALFIDAPIAEFHTQTNFKDMKVIEVIPTGEQLGFTVNKNNPALKSAVNASLKNIIADGSYEKVFKKYFPNLDPSIK